MDFAALYLESIIHLSDWISVHCSLRVNPPVFCVLINLINISALHFQLPILPKAIRSKALQVLKVLWPLPAETSDCFFWIFITNYFRWVVECEDSVRTRSHKSGHFDVILKALRIAFEFWTFAFVSSCFHTNCVGQRSGHNIFSAFSRPFLPGYHAHMW